MSLDRMTELLGDDGGLLAEHRGWINAMGVGSRDDLIALLAEQGYPIFEPLLAFDAQFGGLLVPDEGEGDESDVGIVVGPFHCLSSGGHSSPRGGRTDLVPIAYTSNDCIVFLDAAGAAHFQDTIEDTEATPYAANGIAALAELIRSQHS